MRLTFLIGTVCAITSAASAAEPGRPTAILVSPIHAAQVVHGSDGMDHVEYELLVVSVFPEPITLSKVEVIDPSGKQLTRIEGTRLAAATQTLFAKTATPVVPPSAAVSIDVDLILPPGTAPEHLTHRIAYTLEANSELAVMVDDTQIDGPEVAVDRRPAIVLEPPLKGDGWLVSSGCCEPNIHRDLRIAIDGTRIETAETFAIDWAQVRNGRVFDGDGSKVEQHYAFGQDVLAVADGTVVSIQDGKPEAMPNVPMTPRTKEDYGGNHVILRVAPDVFALYAHLHPGSLKVKAGDAVKAGTPLARIGNTGPSMGPHLHFGISDRPDFFSGRSLPFVFETFGMVGTIDFDTSQGDHVVIRPNPREVRSAYPLYGNVLNFP